MGADSPLRGLMKSLYRFICGRPLAFKLPFSFLYYINSHIFGIHQILGDLIMPNTNNSKSSSAKLNVNGKSVSILDFQDIASDIQVTCSMSPEEVFAFTTRDLFEKWISKSPLANENKIQKNDLEEIQKITAEFEEGRAIQLFSQVSNTLDLAGQLMQGLLSSLPHHNTADPLTHLLEEFKFIQPIESGRVEFFSQINFQSQFFALPTSYKLSSYWVGKQFTEKLESIRFSYPTIDRHLTVRLFEMAGFKGRELYISLPPARESKKNMYVAYYNIPDLGEFPFNFKNLMSSFRITERSV